MGDAVAALRKFALRAREDLDAMRFRPNCDSTERPLSPGHPDYIEGTEGFEPSPQYHAMHMQWGVIRAQSHYLRAPGDYVADLVAIRATYEREHPARPVHSPGDEPAEHDAAILRARREGFYEYRRKGRQALRRLADEAIREAVQWGPLAEKVEGYCRLLLGAVDDLGHSVAASFDATRSDPPEVYAALLVAWFDAFDGLSPFEGTPADKPTAEAVAEAEQVFPPHPGGAPRKHDGSLLASRRKYEESMARCGKKPESVKQWLSKWARANGVTFPEAQKQYESERDRKRRDEKRRRTAD